MAVLGRQRGKRIPLTFAQLANWAVTAKANAVKEKLSPADVSLKSVANLVPEALAEQIRSAGSGTGKNDKLVDKLAREYRKLVEIDANEKRLGVTLAPKSPDNSYPMVMEVKPGGPAALAGLRKGDQIAEIYPDVNTTWDKFDEDGKIIGEEKHAGMIVYRVSKGTGAMKADESIRLVVSYTPVDALEKIARDYERAFTFADARRQRSGEVVSKEDQAAEQALLKIMGSLSAEFDKVETPLPSAEQLAAIGGEGEESEGEEGEEGEEEGEGDEPEATPEPAKPAAKQNGNKPRK